MIRLQRFLCVLVAAGVLMSPVGHAVAQSASNKTCLSFASLPKEADLFVRFPSAGSWQRVDASMQATMLSSPNDSSAEVWVWKQLPASDAQRTVANARTYNVNLTSSYSGASCTNANANYRVAMGSDGYVLAYGDAAPSAPNSSKSNGPSAGAIVGGILVLGLLAALIGGSSSKSSGGSSASSSNDESQRFFEHQREQERQRQEAAERAARERANDEFQRRLQTPNSLGW